MKPSEALKLHRDAILNATKRFKVTNPRVFGSVLHGTDTEGSDLDLLVDALPGATLFDLSGTYKFSISYTGGASAHDVVLNYLGILSVTGVNPSVGPAAGGTACQPP